MLKISLNKKTIYFVLIMFVLAIFSIFYAKAFLQTNPDEVIPPDSFIKEGAVVTLIEEDEKYYIKTENFSASGEYNTPAMEKQINYDEYAQVRSNGNYDILEKRNRHIINDVYVDEYYKAYSDGEIMAGNYISEVLDGYFIPVKLNDFKSTQKVLINDSGIYYLATLHYDKDYNYTNAASYLLLSENQYNEYILNEDYDYIKDITWEISYDGNTIVKTICYYDKDSELIMRPIVLQMTGFEDLEEYINPDDVEEAPEETPNPDDTDDKDTDDKDKDKDKDKDDKDKPGSTKPGKNNSSSNSVGKSENTAPWTGTIIEFPDSIPAINWSAEWSDMGNNASSESGTVDSGTQVVEGYYDDAGNFIKVDNVGNVVPSEDGVFDENSNFIPSGENGYYDVDGVWHPNDTGDGKYDEDGNFEIDGETIDSDGNVITEKPIIEDSGYYDENGNFIEKDGTTIDNDGTIHNTPLNVDLLDSNGNKIMKAEGLLTLDFYGRIIVFDKDGYYDKQGLVHLPDGKVGYYNADGRFFESRQNEHANQGGFYDVDGDFHSFNTIYITENDTTHLILYPEIGLSTDGLKISITGSNYQYSSTGLVVKENKKGYFNEVGEFIKSDKSAFKGGFYTEKGSWIDDSLYKVNNKNEIELTYAYFDSFGLYITPNNDRGYFNEDGTFVINKENPYKDNYYNWEGKKQDLGEIYIDVLGNIHRTGTDEVITSTGQITTSKTRKGILDKNKNWFNLGITITSNGEIGHYNEFAKFKVGQIPYLYGYYDAEGYFYRYDGIVISSKGIVGYYDDNGNWIDGVKDAKLDSKGNWIRVDGTVVTSDGKVGYYDKDGVFHEGENPNTEIVLPIGASIDKNGNIIYADGTVIGANGKESYYDENGNLVEGVSPYKDGYYDADGNWHLYANEGIVDSKGNTLLIDGTVISKDGIVGYYDKDGNFVEGINPMEDVFYDSQGNLINSEQLFNNEVLVNQETITTDGTVISTDGTIGYYDKDGNFVKGENPSKDGYYDKDGNWHSYESEGTIDSQGNIVLSDGTVVNADGKKGYYDENGKFIEGTNPYKGGYYDADGNWISNISGSNLDSQGNVILADGTVISSDGTIGYYDKDGNFVKGENPSKDGYYDANGTWHSYESEGNIDSQGNIVLSDGTVVNADGKKGYYDENGKFIEGTNPYKGGYYDSDGNWIPENTSNISDGKVDSNGNVILADGTVISSDGTVGYYDKDGNFVKGENPSKDGYYDANGTWHSYESEGNKDSKGNIILSDGTVVNADGKKGYYNEHGKFIEGTNPYKGGYYDADGNWISENTIPANNEKVDNKGNIITVDGTVISKDGTVGYYDENGNFVKGENPSKDGYYDSNGTWHSYESEGTKDSKGNIILSDGTVVNADGKKGYYDEKGKFIEGTNPYKGGYYDANGNWISENTKTISGGTLDSKGNVILADGTVISSDGTIGYYDKKGRFVKGENPSKDGYYDANGTWHSYESEGTKDSNGNIVLSDGTVVNADGKKGYYDENGKFVEGTSPYKDGYYDANGNWIKTNSPKTQTIEGHYDSEGNWVSTTSIGYKDSNGNIVLPNGVVKSSDGKIGYYDKTGKFVEGTSPFTNGFYDEKGVWNESSQLPANAYYDKNDNLVMEDGIVVTPNGKIGYYDKDGKFNEGTIPYVGGYYDDKGNWVASGNYDAQGNYIMSDGTIVSKNGDVTLPDGTTVKGYIDEDGKLIISENLSGNSYYNEKGELIQGQNPDTRGFYDVDGNYYLNGDSGFYDAAGNYHATDGTTGYYDENGVWHKGSNPHVNGFYDKDGVWHGSSSINNVSGYYDENGVFNQGTNPYKDGYYDENGVWNDTLSLGTVDKNGNVMMPNGTVMKDGTSGYYDESGIWHEGTNKYSDGFYDAEGNWNAYDKIMATSYTDSKGNKVFTNGIVITPNGKAGYYDETGKFIEGESPYKNGYYDEKGVWHESTGESKAYFDANGNLVMPDGTILDKNGNVIGKMGAISSETKEPLISYYDENGQIVYGSENPYEGGYYDSKGNWHSDGGNIMIDKNGNAHLQDGGIGYYDSEGNLHLNNDSGYYDLNGTYHAADGTIGYYDKNGVFHKGEENPYTGGFYDKYGNWHPEGELGYYDKNGVWHESVSNNVVGYYDENGNFNEGTNPYTNGYYNENGEWFGDGPPRRIYYDADGNLIEGENPYTDGFYDKHGNWHPTDADGYYDSNGTYHKKDGTVGYYDSDGIFHLGTNPYIEGYYDSEGNWHPKGEAGYYDSNGTYYNPDGTYGYYDANGNWIANQENPYNDGYYDSVGNWYPFNQEGYYDKDGVWHPLISVNEKYKYGSKEYILFTGTWRTATENKALKLAGNTVQFTINKNSINKTYIDTGIYVALNSILEYEEAKDILHSIALSTNNVFIQDFDSCMIVYNGRIISLNKQERVTVKTLKEFFNSTNIDITVAKTRVGKKYVLVEAIETSQNIKLKFNDTIITPKYPLTVIDNEAYVALSDISDIIAYNYAMKPSGKNREITFTLKSAIPYEELREYFSKKVIMTTEDGTVNYSSLNNKTKVEVFKAIKPTLITLNDGSQATYIPIKIVPRLTGCDASFDTSKYIIDFNYSEGIAIMKDYYDSSNDLDGDESIEFKETKSDKVE